MYKDYELLKKYNLLNEIINEIETKRKIEYSLFKDSILNDEKNYHLNIIINLDDKLCLLYTFRTELILKQRKN